MTSRLIGIIAGDLVVVSTSGGAGCGDPRRRDPVLVRRDVEQGVIDTRTAQHTYGLEAGKARA